MERHTPKLYFCTECRTVYVGHHNPGPDDADDHYTPPQECPVCEGGEFEELPQ